MPLQRTINTPIHATGVGLHTGEKVHLTLKPAPVDSGIVFRRVDVSPIVDIEVSPQCVSDTLLSTTISTHDGKTRISTVEHLMSALSGMDIDNVLIELDAGEVPIMDGSATHFVFLIESAGVRELAAPRRSIRILQPIEVSDGDKWARLTPFDGFKVDFEIDFDHPILRDADQSCSVDFTQNSYVRTVSRARTFGFMHELEYLLNKGLAQGASFDNAIAIDSDHVLNEDGLRSADEFVKHKVLDAIGDLYMLGRPLIGAYAGFKSGHALNNQLVRALATQPKAWALTGAEDLEDAA